jgi:hypothetical protein
LQRANGFYVVCPKETVDEWKITLFREWLLAQV